MNDLLPVKARDARIDHLAFAAALGAGLLAHQVCTLLHQQRLVATDDIDRQELLLQVGSEFFRVDAHYSTLAA